VVAGSSQKIKGVQPDRALSMSGTMAMEDMYDGRNRDDGTGLGEEQDARSPSVVSTGATRGRDIRGDYAPRAVEPVAGDQSGLEGPAIPYGVAGNVEPGDFAIPGRRVEPPLATASSPAQADGAVEPGVASTEAPASSGDQPWHVQLGNTIGSAISSAINAAIGGQKPDWQQGAQDIQQRQATLPGTPQADALAQEPMPLQPVRDLVSASRQDYETYTRLNGRLLQGETLTPDEEMEMSRAAINVVGDVSGVQRAGRAGTSGVSNVPSGAAANSAVSPPAPSAGIVSRAQADEAATLADRPGMLEGGNAAQSAASVGAPSPASLLPSGARDTAGQPSGAGAIGLRAAATGAGSAYNEAQDPESTPGSVLQAGLGGVATAIGNRAVGSRFGRRAAGVLNRAAEQMPPEREAPPPLEVVKPEAPNGKQIPRQERAAELSRPIALTTKEEIDRLRLDKFPVEARQEILNAAQDSSYGARLRRGVLGDEEVQQLAQEYAPTVEQAIRASHRGKAYNAEEVLGLRNLVVSQEAVVRELTKEIAEKGFDVGLAAQLAAERGALVKIGEIAFGGAPAEAGRALRAFRQDAKNIAKNPSRAGADYLKKQFGSFDKAEEAIARYQKMVDDGADPVALVSFLRNARGGWLNRLQIVRYAGMLAQTTTHAINAGGGVLANAMAIPTKALMVAGDVLKTDFQKEILRDPRPREEIQQVFASEIGAQLAGMKAGAQDGLKQAAFIMQHGFHPDDITQLDHLRGGFGTNIPKIAPEGSRRAKAVDIAFEYPLRALVAGDAIMRGTARGGYAAAEATAAAIKAGRHTNRQVSPDVLRELMDNPSVAQRADDLSRRDVLQEETAARRFSGWLKTQPELLQQAVSQVMPFTATPYAIVAQGVGMTPLGVAKAIRDAKLGKGARHVEETLARSVIGTSVMGVAAWQYANGNLTGPYPEDEKTRSTLPPGWREWSVKSTDANGETKYYPLAPLGALGLPAAAAIMIAEEHKAKGTVFTPEALGKIGLGIGKYMIDQTSMRGMSDLAEAMSRGGGAMDNLLEGVASSYSPHVLGGGGVGRQLQQLMGMPMRDPGNALEALLATHPATAGQVPVRRDVIGRPRTNSPDDFVEGAISTVVRSSKENDAPVIAAFRRAGEGLPMGAPKSVRDPITGEVKALTDRQRERWKIVFGQELQRSYRDYGRPRDPDDLREIEADARKAAADQVLIGR
jgi:hypothetical protein